MELINRKIAIIGYGRFGKLLTEILKDFGDIFVIDQFVIKEKVNQIDYSDLKNMDWVILAVPISQIEKIVKQIVGFLKPGTLVIDVCSVKTHPVKVLQENLSSDTEILGTHPMFGPDSAKYGLAGLQIVICPKRISKKNLQSIKEGFLKLKLSVLEMTPEEHDRQMAKSLILVHYLGRALNFMDLKSLEIKTLGLKRLIAIDETVNNDTWELFFDMNNYNPYADQVRQELRDNLNNLETKIKNKKEKKHD